MPTRFRTPGYHPARKFKTILSGLHHAAITDFSVAYKVILSMPILGVCFFLRQWIDISIVLLAMGLVLVAELFNSAIEVLCDFVEPQRNEQIRITKDIAAAAVGVSIGIWAVTLGIEIIRLVNLTN